MKLDLIAVGRLKAGPERDLAERYAERFRAIGRNIGLDGPRVVELPESLARRDADRKAEEGEAILVALPAGFRLIAMDERGQPLDSEAVAGRVERWRDAGATGLAIAIGGADGLSDMIRTRADLVLSFGRMTIPHQLVRVLALEQFYRIATILSGHPYHRA